MKRSALIRVSVFAALAGIFTTSPAFVAGAEEAKPGIISVSGTGSATLRPDIAVLSLTVLRREKTARAALSANNEAMANVITNLQSLGVAERDLQTSNFHIRPEISRPKNSSGSGNQNAPVIRGYQVSNSLTVRIRDLSKLGEILDASVSLGVNSGGQIQFTSSDPSKAIRSARKRAMAKATAKAKTLTLAANVELGRIINISENQSRSQPRQLGDMRAMAMKSAPSVPIASGENEYRITVHVQWELKQ